MAGNDDLPDFKIEMNLRRNIYKNHPRRNDIAGSIEEITKITKEDLYKCYNSFYIPNNMFVLVVGNFDIKEAEKIIKDEMNSKEYKDLPTIYEPKEQKSVLKKEETIHVPIEIPKVAIGIKIPKMNMDLFEQDLYLTMLTTLIFGASSEFRERVRKKELLNEIYLEWESIKEFNTFYLFATTTKPNSLVEAIEEELDNINVTEKDFERIKKVWIANEVKITDSITSMQRSVFYDIIMYNKVIDNKIDIIRKLSFKKLTKLIKEIDFKNRSKLIALSNNKE